MLGSPTKKIEKLKPILSGMEAYKWWTNLFHDLNMTCLSLYINMRVIYFEENQVNHKIQNGFGLRTRIRLYWKTFKWSTKKNLLFLIPELMLKMLEDGPSSFRTYYPASRSLSCLCQAESEWSPGYSVGLSRATGISPPSTPRTTWLSLSG